MDLSDSFLVRACGGDVAWAERIRAKLEADRQAELTELRRRCRLDELGERGPRPPAPSDRDRTAEDLANRAGALRQLIDMLTTSREFMDRFLDALLRHEDLSRDVITYLAKKAPKTKPTIPAAPGVADPSIPSAEA